MQRYLSAQSTQGEKAADRGMATLAYIFEDVAAGTKEFRLQHKDSGANNVSTHGTVVALRRRTKDSKSLNYGSANSDTTSICPPSGSLLGTPSTFVSPTNHTRAWQSERMNATSSETSRVLIDTATAPKRNTA